MMFDHHAGMHRPFGRTTVSCGKIVAPLVLLLVAQGFTGVAFAQNTGTLRGDDCDTELKEQSLIEFTKQCTAAIGIEVPELDCDKGTLVPDTHPTMASYPNQICDRPNVLNGACDMGSMFQVMKQTNEVAIVGHCRKKGHPGGGYRDIAIIQYNKKNGATCFYQALDSDLPAVMPAPIKGNAPGVSKWKSPKETADINCVQCHDTGPFVRSPYLAQLRNEVKDRLPGTNPGPGPFDQRFNWNLTLPYTFIGNSFQSWKAYALSITGAGEGCLGCHRLGFSAAGGSFNIGSGTAQNFANIATAEMQLHKHFPHSSDSPIWMLPGQITYDAAVETEAHAAAACATAISKKLANQAAPDPPAGCQFAQIAQGDTCRGPPVRGVLNGPTRSDPVPGRVDITVDSGVCENGKCPPGFCYWTAVHGPFWQNTPSNVPIADPAYRGSFLRIFGEDGIWKMRTFADNTGLPPMAAPGGAWACTRYDEIVAVPDTSKCYANLFAVEDKDGTHATVMQDASVTTDKSANVLSGLIGNIAQSPLGATGDKPDTLRVATTVPAAKVTLSDNHATKLASPLKIGPLKGESWTNGCTSWSPAYIVKDMFTTNDIQLLTAAQSKNGRCYITGVTGGWSTTSSGGSVQPFAEIYLDSGKATRLRVAPINGNGRVGAYASCIKLK